MIRWGLLGTAHVNRRLIPAMREARRSSVSAVASRDAARAEAYAREWNIPVAHGSYDALLRDPRVDAIYVPLPNALHVEWTLRALDAGKHVLCEKPLAQSPDDVDRLAAVALGRGLVLAEGFMYRHEPLTERVLELLHDGVVGRVQRVNAEFTYLQGRTPDVRLDAALGGGSLWDIGCYAVNAARLAAGAEPVQAFGFAVMAAHGVDDSFTGLLRFDEDIVAVVHSSFSAPARMAFEVSGTEGVLRVGNLFRPAPLEEIEIRRGEAATVLPVEGSKLLFVRQVEGFIAAALDGTPTTVPLRDSRGNAAALAALYESARTGRAVTI